MMNIRQCDKIFYSKNLTEMKNEFDSTLDDFSSLFLTVKKWAVEFKCSYKYS